MTQVISQRSPYDTGTVTGHLSMDHTTDTDRSESLEGICDRTLISAVHDPRGRMTRVQSKDGELLQTITQAGKGHANSVTSLLLLKVGMHIYLL